MFFFADDGHIVAPNRTSLEIIMNWVHRRLKLFGFQLQIPKCSWGFAGSIDNSTIHDHLCCDGVSLPASDTRTLKILGTMIDLEGSTVVAVQDRIRKAWAYWHQRKNYFVNRHVDRRVRALVANHLVSYVVMWGHECWNLTDKELRLLKQSQIRMLRATLGFRPYWGETPGHFWRRTHRQTHDFIIQEQLWSWDQLALHFHWKWAGHILRSPCILRKILQSWNLTWEYTNQLLFGNRARADRGRQITWEHEIHHYCLGEFGMLWHELAIDMNKNDWGTGSVYFRAWRARVLRERRQISNDLLRVHA
jgi:hypothetical protein